MYARVHARPRYEASLRAISNGLHRPSANVKFDVHDYCGPPGRPPEHHEGGWTTLDVNFIIPAKKLRPSSRPSPDLFSSFPPRFYTLYVSATPSIPAPRSAVPALSRSIAESRGTASTPAHGAVPTEILCSNKNFPLLCPILWERGFDERSAPRFYVRVFFGEEL